LFGIAAACEPRFSSRAMRGERINELRNDVCAARRLLTVAYLQVDADVFNQPERH
jgi:hypothetical protein